ncbi:hypothetical protein, partial [Pseudomonas syringae group genomosp. 7]|uniref:hypothetical protein n=1 Tax=Pseudomonas syringae group genomosp. 7 TaxID=251699 RepID=UPI0037701DE7
GGTIGGGLFVSESSHPGYVSGAVVLLAAITWTVVSTREYSPVELAGFDDAEPPAHHAAAAINGPAPWAHVAVWLGLGVLLALLIAWRQGDRMLYVLAGLCAGYGLLLAAARA